MQTAARPSLAFALPVSATVVGIAGTDLVLPAVPGLPGALGGTLEQAQCVLAAFATCGDPRSSTRQREIIAGPSA